jgi:hypothetical protein
LGLAYASATLLGSGNVLFVGGRTRLVDGWTKGTSFFSLLSAASTCTSSGECLSGFCVEGVCCDDACTSACSACDVIDHVGACTIVDHGPPHGTKSCAPYGTCVAGACGTHCANDDECSRKSKCVEGACLPR